MYENLILPFISLILIIIVLAICVITISSELFPSTTTLKCPRGYCKNSVYSGEKVCPPDPEGYIEYTPGSEVCNPETACLNSSQTPCVYTDPSLGTSCPGDEGYTGVCSDSNTSAESEQTLCRCLDRVYCPDFATTFFERQIIPDGSFQTFVQNTVWISPTNAQRSDLPLSLGYYSDQGQLTCGLSENLLPYVWPPRTCVRGEFAYNVENNLWYCMDTSVVCGSGQYLFRHENGNFTCNTLDRDPFI